MTKQTRPMSQLEIEWGLDQTDQEIQALTDAFLEVIKAAAEAESAYKQKHAEMYFKAKATVGATSATDKSKYADSMTGPELQAHLVTEAVAKYHRAAIQAKERTFEKLRTLNANLRNIVDPFR